MRSWIRASALAVGLVVLLVALPSAALGEGGASISSAAPIPIGTEVTGYRVGSSTDFDSDQQTAMDFWWIDMTPGQKLTIDFEFLPSSTGTGAVCILKQGQTDFNFSYSAGCDTYPVSSVAAKNRIVFTSPIDARWILYARRYDESATGTLAYKFTSTLKTPAVVPITPPIISPKPIAPVEPSGACRATWSIDIRNSERSVAKLRKRYRKRPTRKNRAALRRAQRKLKLNRDGLRECP